MSYKLPITNNALNDPNPHPFDAQVSSLDSPTLEQQNVEDIGLFGTAHLTEFETDEMART